MSGIINKDYVAFSGGINTEINYTKDDKESFGTCSEITNFKLTKNGSITKRGGFTQSYERIFCYNNLRPNIFLWRNVMGNNSDNFYVVSIGSELFFYDANKGLYEENRIDFEVELLDYIDPNYTIDNNFKISFAVGNGVLYLADKRMKPLKITYDKSLKSFDISNIDIYVRDYVGYDIEEDFLPKDLITSEEKYNLYNTGFTEEHNIGYLDALSRYPFRSENPYDLKVILNYGGDGIKKPKELIVYDNANDINKSNTIREMGSKLLNVLDGDREAVQDDIADAISVRPDSIMSVKNRLSALELTMRKRRPLNIEIGETFYYDYKETDLDFVLYSPSEIYNTNQVNFGVGTENSLASVGVAGGYYMTDNSGNKRMLKTDYLLQDDSTFPFEGDPLDVNDHNVFLRGTVYIRVLNETVQYGFCDIDSLDDQEDYELTLEEYQIRQFFEEDEIFNSLNPVKINEYRTPVGTNVKTQGNITIYETFKGVDDYHTSAYINNIPHKSVNYVTGFNEQGHEETKTVSNYAIMCRFSTHYQGLGIEAVYLSDNIVKIYFPGFYVIEKEDNESLYNSLYIDGDYPSEPLAGETYTFSNIVSNWRLQTYYRDDNYNQDDYNLNNIINIDNFFESILLIKDVEIGDMIDVDDGITIGTNETEYFDSIEFYANRIFYSSLNNEKYLDHIFYSQQRDLTYSAGKCYSENDPNAEFQNSGLDTDGGYITIPNAERILEIITLKDKLLVLCSNGIWAVGGNPYFTSNNFSIEKISNVGLLNKDAYSVISDTICYAANEGLYILNVDQGTGTLTTSNFSNEKIKSIYSSIPKLHREQIRINYDKSSKTLKILYADRYATNEYDYNRVMFYDFDLKAFYEYEFSKDSNDTVVDFFENLNYNDESINSFIVKTGDNFFAVYSEEEYKYFDFENDDSINAILETNYINYGDLSNDKNIRYIETFAENIEDAVGEVQVKYNSSLIKNNDWSNKSNIYRNVTKTDGNIHKSKTAVRGQGLFLKIRFESVGAGSMNLLGWTTITSGNTNT